MNNRSLLWRVIFIYFQTNIFHFWFRANDDDKLWMNEKSLYDVIKG